MEAFPCNPPSGRGDMPSPATLTSDGLDIPAYDLDTVIVGAGAAGLRCAVTLQRALAGQPGRRVAVLTEELHNSTSYNAGSDKQTFYTWGVARGAPDSPRAMAQQLYDGHSVDGDLALVQANLSARAFYGLVEAGVPFPHDEFGGYGGYITDHSPSPRGSSVGPLTSKAMVENLFEEAQRLSIPVFDRHQVVSLITDGGRALGVLTLDMRALDSDCYGLTAFHAQNVVFAVGGPGGMYQSSVYPTCHNGSIGVALEAGARAINLTESQHGLASVKFRWNVSGTYQQVVPRYFSTDADGGDARDFLNEFFPTMGALATAIFLKGYQWPFDPRKIADHGSSLIDVLVYIETVTRGRRVFMDFRENPRPGDGIEGYAPSQLSPEALQYLTAAGASDLPTPIDRLRHMNPQAIELYRGHGIDIASEPLEVRVCNQHNNGGIETDARSESTTLRRLFAVGEVAGQHGVYRPGGSDLNAGQTFAIMAADTIAYDYHAREVSYDAFRPHGTRQAADVLAVIRLLLANGGGAGRGAYRDSIQERMTRAGAHIRGVDAAYALASAYAHLSAFSETGVDGVRDLPAAFTDRQFAVAHAAYLDAVSHYVERGGGSRGSYLVRDDAGIPALDSLGSDWRYKAEDEEWRELALLTEIGADGAFHSRTRPRRPIPGDDFQFEREMNRFAGRGPTSSE